MGGSGGIGVTSGSPMGGAELLLRPTPGVDATDDFAIHRGVETGASHAERAELASRLLISR
jgi:hypothetical protein